MRVAALYDIHANLPALEAVLAEVRHANVDHVIVGGDVLPGPFPRETLRCLLDLEIPTTYIYGNGETAVLEQLAGREPAGVPAAYRPSIAWTAEQIRDDQPILAAWPLTAQITVNGLGDVLFCHATPRHENDCFSSMTPEERLIPVFDHLGVSVVVCGHTHMQFDRMVGQTRVVNAGSVGMPFGRPGADWLLLAPNVAFQHTSYDRVAAAASIRSSTFPYPEDFADRYVLNPPAASDMLDLLTRASI